MNPLEGRRLDYLIGRDHSPPHPLRVQEFSYDAKGGDIRYVNLRDEKNTKAFCPCLPQDDIQDQYSEPAPDPRYGGFKKNIIDQLARAHARNMAYVELDNPDTYHWTDVLRVYRWVDDFGLRVIAKNPLLTENPLELVKYPSVVGVIVENAPAQTSDALERLRVAVGKPRLPVWFVAFADRSGGLRWAQARKRAIDERGYVNMYVTFSADGEYTSVRDL